MSDTTAELPDLFPGFRTEMIEGEGAVMGFLESMT